MGNYVADPVNGFRVAGTNLPVGPAVPATESLAAPVFDLPLPVAVEDTPEVVAAKAEFQAAFDRLLPERREMLMKLLLPLLQLLLLSHTHMLLDSHMPLNSQLLLVSHTPQLSSQLLLLLLMLQLSSPLLTHQLLLNTRLLPPQLLPMLVSHTLPQLPPLWLLQLLHLLPLLQLLLLLLLQLVMLSSPPSSLTQDTPPSTRLTKHLI